MFDGHFTNPRAYRDNFVSINLSNVPAKNQHNLICYLLELMFLIHRTISIQLCILMPKISPLTNEVKCKCSGIWHRSAAYAKDTTTLPAHLGRDDHGHQLDCPHLAILHVCCLIDNPQCVFRPLMHTHRFYGNY